MNTMKEEDYLPLREVVFMTLRKQILRGELKPGERRDLSAGEVARVKS